MSKLVSSSSLAAVVIVCCLGIASTVAGTGLEAVPKAPGAFEPQGGPKAVIVKGEPLNAAQVEALAGKPGGYDLLVDGDSVFGMDYAHRAGRREPLRPMTADLADWNKAPQCPPDRVLVDPRTGRIRFFSGHDPAKFQSEVLAAFRGTHGDAALPIWRGNTLFLTHWESSYHVWAYDVSDPSAPRQVGETPITNYLHGFVLLDNGYALAGTTSPKGVFLLDLRDPARMKIVGDSLVPRRKPSVGVDWVGPINTRYVAVWPGWGAKYGAADPRVFDTAGLPGSLPEVTSAVPAAVLPYVASRLGELPADGKGWFECAKEEGHSIAALDLSGPPAKWRVLREVKLRDRCQGIKPLGDDRFALFYAGEEGKKWLRVLDAAQGHYYPPLEVPDQASSLSVLQRRFAYLTVLPKNRGAGVVGTYDGTYQEIYDLSQPDRLQRAGKWHPGVPTRDLALHPQPGRPQIVLALEPGSGFGFHLCDFSDPLKPKVLAHVPTGGEGNRVAAWGDKALYTSSTLAQWFDLSDPLAPKRLSTWFNHRWFWVRAVYNNRAVVSMEGRTQVIDFSDARKPQEVMDKVPGGDSWGTRLYEAQGGPRSGRGPIRLTIADMADPARLQVLSETQYSTADLDTPGVNGLCADGPLLYGITEGAKGKAVFLIWDVADPKKPVLLTQLRHPELQVQRGEGFWTAQGHVIAAAHGIAVVTSYGSGPPQVIDARDPRHPKFLMRLPYQGRRPNHGNEMIDCRADGRWFYIKSYPDPVQLWDFSRPQQPRQIWEEPGQGPYGYYAWQAGVPVGPLLLVPQLSVLKVLTVPRPSQVPPGKLTWQ